MTYYEFILVSVETPRNVGARTDISYYIGEYVEFRKEIK